MLAPIGAGMTVAGMGLGAIGQAQGTRAMQKAWGHAMDLQRGYDDQLKSKTNELISGINPNAFLGTERTQELMPVLQNNSISLADAIRNHGTRRTAGSQGGAEFSSRVNANSANTLADALRSGKLAAILAGFDKGGRDMNLRGSQFALDTGNIRRDASAMAQLAQLWEQAAALEGSGLRQAGGLLSSFGPGLMMYGMSQAPGAAGGGTLGNSGATQMGPQNIGDMTPGQQ